MRRIAGDNKFPYKFPFRFNAAPSTRTVSTATGRTINDTG